MIITDNKNQDNERTDRGLENDVPQNSGLDPEQKERINDTEKTIGKPVDNGGVQSIEYDRQLEKQWLAVRDEYLANYPHLENTDINYEKGSFYKMIEKLAKRRKRTSKEIQNEIMDWSIIK